MIYIRWGDPIEIIGNCGEHKPRYLAQPDMLLKIHFLGVQPADDFRFLFTLRADDGWKEIQKAMDAAPVLDLSSRELKDAFVRAK